MYKIILLLNIVACGVSNGPNNNTNNEKLPSKKIIGKNEPEFKNNFVKADNAIINNDLNQLKEAIETEPGISNFRYSDSPIKETMLMRALLIQEDNMAIDRNDVIKLLLKESDLSAADDYGYSVLHYAVFSEEYVKFILENANVDVNLEAKNGSDPLMRAASEGYPESVRILLEHENIKILSKYEDITTLPNNRSIKTTLKRDNIIHKIARGIFDPNGKFDNAFHSKNIEKKEEVIKDYKRVFELLNKSNKFNMKEALNQKDSFDRTPLQLFIDLADARIGDRKEVEVKDAFGEGLKTHSRDKEMEYWNEIKETFLPLFEQK